MKDIPAQLLLVGFSSFPFQINEHTKKSLFPFELCDNSIITDLNIIKYRLFTQQNPTLDWRNRLPGENEQTNDEVIANQNDLVNERK